MAACPPRQCPSPPKPSKVSGNLPTDLAGFWMKPQTNVQEVSAHRVSLAALETPPPCLQGYLWVIRAGLKKGEKRLHFKRPFNQEVWRGEEGGKKKDFFSDTEDITC